MNELIASQFTAAVKQSRMGGFSVSGSKFSRAAIIGVFELNGGIESFATWAEDNPTEFYTKLFGKMVGREETQAVEDNDMESLLKTLDGEYEDTTPPDATVATEDAPPVPDDPPQTTTPEPEDDLYAPLDALGYSGDLQARLARRALIYARGEPSG